MSFVGAFFLAVFVVGFSELWLLVRVASGIGFLGTAGLCILTGVIGGTLVRAQGLRTLQQIQNSFARGQVPTVEIVSGFMLLVVGVTLIMPGFVTDAVGFALLIPQLRRLAAERFSRWFERRTHVVDLGQSPAAKRGKGRVIDVDPED